MTITEALKINEMIFDDELALAVYIYESSSPYSQLKLEKKIIERAAYIAPRLEKINKTDFLQYCAQLIDNPETARKAKQKCGWIKADLLRFIRNDNTLLVEKIDDKFLMNFLRHLETYGYRRSIIIPTFGYIRFVLNHVKAEHGLRNILLSQHIMIKDLIPSGK